MEVYLGVEGSDGKTWSLDSSGGRAERADGWMTLWVKHRESAVDALKPTVKDYKEFKKKMETSDW